VKIGTGKTAAGAINYLAGIGDYEGRNDLEFVTARGPEVERCAQEIEKGARVKHGPTAERVLMKLVVELPDDFDQAQRRQVASRLVTYWQEKGHPAVAAVHHLPGEVQPHIHVAITARPIIFHEGQRIVDRSTDKRLLIEKSAVRAERKAVAEIINAVAGRDVFHPGTLRETGIDRPAQRRVTIKEWRAGHRGKKDPAVVDQMREQYAREREERAVKKAETERVAMVKRAAGWQKVRESEPYVKMKAQRDAMEAALLKEQVKAQKRPLERQAAPEPPKPRQTDELPATGKQIAFLNHLAVNNLLLDDLQRQMGAWEDLAPTRGWAGEKIRQLQEIDAVRSGKKPDLSLEAQLAFKLELNAQKSRPAPKRAHPTRSRRGGASIGD